MPIQPAAQLTQIPPFPALSDRAAGVYNSKAYAFGVHMGGTDAATPGPFVAEINNLAQNVVHNAQEAESAAIASSDAAAAAAMAAGEATAQADAAMGYRNAAQAGATTAATKASEAEASAVAASKLNLGDKAAPPTTDNQGQPLRAGATYYDTTLGKWRVWTGAAWGGGISAVAGVSSLNGQTGDVTIAKDDVGLGNVDNTADNTKAVLSASKLTTARTINGKSFDGSANVTIPGNPTVVAATGGVMDCSAGDRFTLTVSGNVTLSFANIPAGSYACVLEVLHTAGTITFPAGTVWSGIAPTLTAGRHLFFFDRAQLGTAGWYASALPGYSA